MRSCLALILTLIVFGCNGTKNLVAYSELTIENRNSNNLIVDRKTNYRFDNGDGDVILNEISMNIHKLTEKQIAGKVFDSKTKEPLSSANLDLFFNTEEKESVMTVKTDSQGNFECKLSGPLKEIEARYIAYRNLKIRLEK